MYDVIIGLEVHVQLLTNSKLFCGCSTQFGQPPNTQTCPVCLGLPGSLPVMNRRAYELGLKAALALHLDISQFTKWDRKQYYYPDLPKGYQISQYDLPMSEQGWLEIRDSKGRFEPKRIGITRAHLEEDAGKSLHDEAAGKADSRIDLNRTGTPLLEIVSEPDMRSPEEARAYLDELKLMMTYLGVSDCNMQEGSLRVDANINLHVHGKSRDNGDGGRIPTPIVEIKNMNSFRAVERALAYEAERQWEVWQDEHIKLGDPGGHKTTRGWDDAAQVTRPQREKEESSDYRYFPDPDLVPVTVTEEQIELARESLGELPAALRVRLETDYQISAYDADVIVNQGRALVDYFEATARASDGKLASNWVQQDVMRTLKEQEQEIGDYAARVPPDALAELLKAVQNRQVDTTRGRDVLSGMYEGGRRAAEVMQELGIEKVDAGETVALCKELLAANPKIVADLQEGKMKAVGALIGQAKKKNPNVDPAQVRETCVELVKQGEV